MAITLNSIKGLPDDFSKLDYKCNDKSRSADEILGHSLGHAEVMYNAMDNFIPGEKTTHQKFKKKEEMASYFENYASKLVEKLKSVDDKT